MLFSIACSPFFLNLKKQFMPISKLKLNNAVNILEDEIKTLEDELSYLKAAKKNIETLTAKLNGDVQPKKETELVTNN